MKNFATKKDVSDLAAMANRGFEAVQKSIDGSLNSIVSTMAGNFIRLEKKMDKGFSSLQNQIDRIDTYTLNDHERRLKTVEQKLDLSR